MHKIDGKQPRVSIMSNEDQVILNFPLSQSEQNIFEVDPDRLELISTIELNDDDTTLMETTLPIAGAKRPYWRQLFG
jgi:hypothetical protein